MPSAKAGAGAFARLGASDEPALVAFLELSPYQNVFALANIHRFGWTNPRVRYWGAWRERRLVAVVGALGSTFLLSDPEHQYGGEIAALLDTHPEVTNLNGPWDEAAPVVERLAAVRLAVHREQFCAMPVGTVLPDPPPYVRRATPADIAGLLDLYRTGEIRRDRAGIDRSLRDDTMYLAEIDGVPRSALIVVGPTRQAAMIIAVLTEAPSRGRGYAGACVTAACRDLLVAGRVPCLFWRNPAAGRLYARLGFQPIGEWLLGERANDPPRAPASATSSAAPEVTPPVGCRDAAR